MNIENEIKNLMNEKLDNYSENYVNCLELMVKLRPLDENDIEYNNVYQEFAKTFAKLSKEEQDFLRRIYELDDAILEEIAKSKDQQYDYNLKNKIKNEKINSAHRR